MNIRLLTATVFIATTLNTSLATPPANFALKSESKHFKIFTQQEDSSVPDVLNRAEEVYAQVTKHLNYAPSEKIDIMIFPSVESHHQYFNMQQAPAFLTSRVQNGSVFMVSPSNPGTYHTYQSLINRLGGAIVRSLIDKMPKTSKLPYWLTTGLGLYEAFNGQIIELYAQELKTAVAHNQFLAFEQLANPTHPLASISAYSMAELLIQQHGMTAIPTLVRDFSKFEQIAGLSQEAFYAQWLAYIKKQYS